MSVKGWANQLHSLLVYCMTALLLGMLGVELVNIVGRPMGFPINGSVEITSYLGGILIAICIFYATFAHSNVAVRLLTSKLTGRPRAFMKITASLVALGTVLLLAWATGVYGRKMALEGERSVMLDLNICIIRYVLFASFLSAACVFVVDIYRTLVKVGKKWIL